MIAVTATEAPTAWTVAGGFVLLVLSAYWLCTAVQRRSRNRRHFAELERQANDKDFIHTTPIAYVVSVVDNGPNGWKWLVWDYDPDQRRLMAGQVEGVLVPRGIKDGYPSMEKARDAGITAVRAGGWAGDILLREDAD